VINKLVRNTVHFWEGMQVCRFSGGYCSRDSHIFCFYTVANKCSDILEGSTSAPIFTVSELVQVHAKVM
jgi:hypothetical protein